ncbi:MULTISPECIES: MerR family transcriptional regulator [Priestia]|uniref:MerR family transcriptional regulator n=1 Tax=Priestia TaxID=2800373 RepID=UPI0018A33643|nr:MULTISPECIES: MerR family transcriptional regulator [Priestia]MDR7245206.1 DNA-binding transcriptional MerR regulator [Priestia megaterium]QTL51148.1 MerR family transcriptional regulator [Priestia aryabhattai]USL44116.1 MerR family transcriptional regulator [Priestia megaterium]
MAYSIGEFAKILGVTASSLRYYERQGLLTPKRDENNLRRYTDDDIEWVKFLLHLKDSGMLITELKQYTKWHAIGDKTIQERLDLLENRKHLVQQEIQTLQQSLDILNRKIEFYNDRLRGELYDFVLYPNEESNS